MNRWQGAEGSCARGLLVLLVLAGACGGKASTPARPDAGGGSGGEAALAPAPGSGVPRSAPLGPGWSIRDATPYARPGASAVIDTVGDRLIVFGGGGRDIWALALSGEQEGTWQEVVPQGEEAPAHAARAGVYDPRGNRLLFMTDAAPAADYEDVELWSLSLDDSPHFQRLAQDGPQPGQELFHAQLALDVDGERLFAMGGAHGSCGAWMLSLAGAARWSRLADAPDDGYGVCPYEDDTGDLLVFDGAKQRLVTFGAHYVRQLALDDPSWVSLGTDPGGNSRYFDAPAFDSKHRRVIYAGGENESIATFSLDDDQWQTPVPDSFGLWEAAAAYDARRDRVVYFSGSSSLGGLGVGNATWQLAADGERITALTPNTRGSQPDGSLGWDQSSVWDDTRASAIVANGADAGETWVRDLDPNGVWQLLHVEGSPQNPAASIYDPEALRVVALVRPDATDQPLAVMELPSKGSARWQTLDVAPGPGERARSLAVYDSDARRLLLIGGEHDASYTGPVLDEVWALSLEDGGTWQELARNGASVPRYGAVGAYDTAHHRVIVYGGSDQYNDYDDLHAIALDDDSASWSLLEPLGTPPLLRQASAVVDASNQRLIFVSPSTIAALDISNDVPVWHRFCSIGTPPPERLQARALAVVDDGLFVAAGNGSFRFELSTPYCD